MDLTNERNLVLSGKAHDAIRRVLSMIVKPRRHIAAFRVVQRRYIDGWIRRALHLLSPRICISTPSSVSAVQFPGANGLHANPNSQRDTY